MTKEQFQEGLINFSNHRVLLWPALEATKHLRLPVLELGCGYGSTPYLTMYCIEIGVPLLSYDSNKEWADRMKAIHVPDWSKQKFNLGYSVALVDEAPGEHRKESIAMLRGQVQILVAHDTEKAADHGYQMRNELFKWKYHKEYVTDGAGCMAVSDTIDVSKWIV
jgi:hypothetical protein